MPTVVDKVIEVFMGSTHEREYKRLFPRVAEINAREPEIAALSDDAVRERVAAIQKDIQSRLAELPEEYRERRTLVQGVLDEHLVEVFALAREASRRALGMRHFDVQLIGGMVLHEGRIAEMRTGEGKTLVATLPVVAQRPRRPRRARRHRQRLPRPPRRGVDGPHLQLPRPDGRRHRPRANGRRRAPGRVPLRHHLRHEQRVRLRLPARQHEVRAARTTCSASSTTPSSTRWTRSSSTRRARRSSSPARRRSRSTLLHRSTRSSRGSSGDKDDATTTVDEKSAPVVAHRRRRRAVEKRLGIHNLYDPRQDRDAAPRRAGAARAHALQARRRLRGQGRRGAHRRRVHRPPDAGPPLVATACTRPSRPRKASRSRPRTRRWPPSPSRTTSACTRSWPA